MCSGGVCLYPHYPLVRPLHACPHVSSPTSACTHTCARAIPVALVSLPSFWEVSWGRREVQGVCSFLGCPWPAARLLRTWRYSF